MVELSWSILTTILDNRSIIPWIYNISGTRCKVLVAAAWGLSALFASPMLFISGVPAGRNECWIELPSAFHWQVCILFKEVFFSTKGLIFKMDSFLDLEVLDGFFCLHFA